MENITENIEEGSNAENGKMSFKKLYFSKLRPVLQILEEDRKEIANQQLTAMIFAVAGFLTFVAIIGFKLMTSGMAVIISLILFGIPAAIFFHKYSTAYNVYKSAFKSKIINSMVKNIDETLTYRENNRISREQFLASNIFRQRIDRYNGEDHISGTLDKTAIEFSEVHAEYKTETRDSKGRRQEHWHTIFKGLFFIADFNKEFAACTVVLPDFAERTFGKFGQTLQEWGNVMNGSELVKLENAEFEKYFAVYSYNQIEARYVLTPLMMEKIVEFRKKVNRDIYLSFNNSKMYLGVPFQENLFEPALWSTLLDLVPLEAYYNVMELMVGIVEELNLNTRIWTKE